MMPDNTCITCGRIIPEGRHICLACEHENEVNSFSPKPRTNGDRIRVMSNDELAHLLSYIWVCHHLDACEKCPLADAKSCQEDGVKEWLESEVHHA